MAIIDPPNVDDPTVETISVESDASDNLAAILEIDDWAAENGFVRVKEYRLQQVQRGNNRFFRGTCFRLTQERIKEAERQCRLSDEVLKRMPVTRPMTR